MSGPASCDVAVVGAGPGGMAAAIEAARAGARVVIVDEGYRVGGQIHRQPPQPFGHGGHAHGHDEPPSHGRGAELRAELAQYDVEVQSATTVWDAAPGVLRYERDGRGGELRWRRLVLAPGAIDRCLPFPGWTLPGVITAGGSQVLVRGFRIAPGTRALVAGTGPLLLPTVVALAQAGVEVAAALEANGRGSTVRAGLGVVRSGRRLREAAWYLRFLRRHRIRLRHRWTVLAAEGEEQVEAATIAPLGGDGRPLRHRAERVAVDVVCTGYGLLPSTELAALLGCDLELVPARGGWVVAHDDGMRTSVEGVLVAGEIAGIGGGDVAAAEGAIAGITAARELGLGGGLGLDERLAEARRERARERRVSDALLAAFAPPDGLRELATDDTVVCRCEDVTLGEVRACARVFGPDLRAIKLGCRAGMGPCQGRICQVPIASLLGLPWPRPVVQVPVKAVSLATIAGTDPAAG